MVDIENAVFTAVKKALKEEFSDITVDSTLNLSPAKFPYACIEEADNYVYNRTRDSASIENHAVLMYEVNVYSNKASGKKAEAKAILAVADTVMACLGFTRTTRTPINMEGATVYRLFARYTAIASPDKVIYRR